MTPSLGHLHNGTNMTPFLHCHASLLKHLSLANGFVANCQSGQVIETDENFTLREFSLARDSI